MIKSSVTISLAPQAKGGPFVFWGDLAGSCARAATLGFDGVEIFAPSAEELDAREIKQLLAQHRLKLAAMGTGAGWVLQKLRLTDPDSAVRTRARHFINGIIDFAGSFGAPAIIGSMQGRFEGDVTREQALAWLREALEQMGPRAHACGVPLLFEPLNRYETNLINTVADGLELLRTLRTKNVKLLSDLFHMNIEEISIADALRAGGQNVGHVHFVDSNRRPAGNGHMDFSLVAQALREIGFSGYVSAEALPFPDSEAAAQQTMTSFKRAFR
ncbi:MAG: sugar phosphate isomerase/epimerase [Verrucomicrobia bacterium]|nr:sugar phosphate isomerase/epimerase [Verrucomicrobiota bacterium]